MLTTPGPGGMAGRGWRVRGAPPAKTCRVCADRHPGRAFSPITVWGHICFQPSEAYLLFVMSCSGQILLKRSTTNSTVCPLDQNPGHTAPAAGQARGQGLPGKQRKYFLVPTAGVKDPGERPDKGHPDEDRKQLAALPVPIQPLEPRCLFPTVCSPLSIHMWDRLH